MPTSRIAWYAALKYALWGPFFMLGCVAALSAPGPELLADAYQVLLILCWMIVISWDDTPVRNVVLGVAFAFLSAVPLAILLGLLQAIADRYGSSWHISMLAIVPPAAWILIRFRPLRCLRPRPAA